jgi:hypothetical protein
MISFWSIGAGAGLRIFSPFLKRTKKKSKICFFFRKTKCKSMVIDRVCLDRAKNSVIIEELRIVSEDREKIVIFRLA